MTSAPDTATNFERVSEKVLCALTEALSSQEVQLDEAFTRRFRDEGGIAALISDARLALLNHLRYACNAHSEALPRLLLPYIDAAGRAARALAEISIDPDDVLDFYTVRRGFGRVILHIVRVYEQARAPEHLRLAAVELHDRFKTQALEDIRRLGVRLNDPSQDGYDLPDRRELVRQMNRPRSAPR